MAQYAIQLMRIVLLLLLVQLIAPGFISVSEQGIDSGERHATTIDTEHNTISIIILLKEKEETENEKSSEDYFLTQLIDFSDHSSSLTRFHQEKYNLISSTWHEYQPPLFTLYCTYII